MAAKTLDQLSFSGKRVLMRAGFDVPIKDGKVTDSRRIEATIPTIEEILEAGATQLIIIAHEGRPGGKVVPELSLKPVAARLGKLLGENVAFVPDVLGKVPQDRVVLMENLRFHPEEKGRDKKFAEQIAAQADIFVEDAFNNLHHDGASMTLIPECFKEKGIGLLVEKELRSLDFSNPEHPFIAIIGAAKIGDKLPVLETLLQKVDKLLLGGAMIFTFYKAMGYEIGKSLLDAEKVTVAKKLLEKHKGKIILPSDVVVSEEREDHEIFTVAADKIPKNMIGLDIGDGTIDEFKKALDGAKTIFWNGPMGVFEIPPFDHGTKAIAEHVAKMHARTILGGGDTDAAVDKFGLAQYYTYISTGGGASLQIVAGKELPGLKALE